LYFHIAAVYHCENVVPVNNSSSGALLEALCDCDRVFAEQNGRESVRIKTKEVPGDGMVIGSGMVIVSRELAEANGCVPNQERIDGAKARFKLAGLHGARLLIETVQQREDAESVVGYYGFTLDRDSLTRTPLTEGETTSDRGMKIMCLPHPQWGNRFGTATVIGDLVSLSEDPKLSSLSSESASVLELMFSEGANFLARGSSEGA
jgi:hypothetical protein